MPAQEKGVSRVMLSYRPHLLFLILKKFKLIIWSHLFSCNYSGVQLFPLYCLQLSETFF